MNRIVLCLLVLMVFASCGEDEPMINIESPTSYIFERGGESTVSFSGQTTRIGMATELIAAMNDASLDSEFLVQMYANQSVNGDDVNPFSDPSLNESSKSVKSKVAASNDFFSSNTTESAEIKADIESWIVGQVTEVFPNENNLASAGQAGQIADGSSARYVNSKGLEYNQAVNKSLIGALMVDQICNNYLSSSVLDAGDNISNNNNQITEEGKSYTTMEHKWDEAYGYLFGASSDSTDPLSTLGDDIFLNKYLLRVDDDEDFAGIANDIFEAFKLGRAAIVAGELSIRDQQAEIIRAKVAEVVAVRAVYYLQQGKLALANNDMGGAFHDLSEGFGFVYSLRFTRKANSGDAYFSKNEVDGFISQLTTGNGFWDLTDTILDNMSNDIASKFDFTVSQAAE